MMPQVSPLTRQHGSAYLITQTFEQCPKDLSEGSWVSIIMLNYKLGINDLYGALDSFNLNIAFDSTNTNLSRQGGCTNNSMHASGGLHRLIACGNVQHLGVVTTL